MLIIVVYVVCGCKSRKLVMMRGVSGTCGSHQVWHSDKVN